jgi:predicted nucleic acid-binding protein
MVLVDTSSWIHMLRADGDVAVRARVEALLHNGSACWCPMVRLELWNGARGDADKKALRDFERYLPELPITEGVWKLAYSLVQKTRSAGITVPATDALIAACAKFHDAKLEHVDSDFERLEAVYPQQMLRESGETTGDIIDPIDP